MPVSADVLVETDGPVGVVVLNRPRALNALSAPMMKAVADAIEAFAAADAVRVIVLAGGARAFAAGADVGEMQDLADAGQARAALAAHLARWDAVGLCRKPTVAAVSGFALGGGCELALACDLVVASETAVFGQPEVLLGVMPGAGGTQRLARAVGKAVAMEMCLLGRRLSAREALARGLVNRVVPAESCLSEAKTLARRIAAMPAAAVRAIARAVRESADVPLDEGLERERRAFYSLFGTADQKEGMAAFAEKRRPAWSGR